MKKHRTKQITIIFLLAIVAGVVVFLVITKSHNKATNSVTTNKTINVQSSSGQTQKNTQIPTSTTTGSNNLGTANQIIAPSGEFVSNHKPSLSSMDEEASVCNTTVGATCIIIFTQNGTTKSLSSQKTDNNGAAYWTWSLQDIGLTQGNWQISAQASLNGQTKTTNDPEQLQVNP